MSARAASCATTLAIVGAVPLAQADRYEGTLQVQPTASLARVEEAGTMANVGGGGLALALGYGMRNWLDVGGELVGAGFTGAHYPMAMATIAGSPRTGDLTRTTRLAQLRIGATVRLGVTWVPSLSLGFGAGARLRSAATFTPAGEASPLAIDGGEAATTLDLIALARVGLDHRFSARWSLGLSVSAARCFGFGASNLDLLDATVTVAYRWYPTL